MADTITINRAPVLTLWAAVVAERLGFDRATSLTLGQAVAGKSAYAKGVSLGIIEPKPELVREGAEHLGEGEQLFVGLLGKPVPVVQTPDGLRAVAKGNPATRLGSRNTLRRSSTIGSMAEYQGIAEPRRGAGDAPRKAAGT